jgi:hypothetical protein
MKELSKSDFVIYDKASDNPLQDGIGDIILFGSKDEAIADCYANEIVISCVELPNHWIEKLQNQINND